MTVRAATTAAATTATTPTTQQLLNTQVLDVGAIPCLSPQGWPRGDFVPQLPKLSHQVTASALEAKLRTQKTT